MESVIVHSSFSKFGFLWNLNEEILCLIIRKRGGLTTNHYFLSYP
nr:MAG TPA: hypothetical protein [Caudoviricetes sp.]